MFTENLFYLIYNEIKDFIGYKRYTVEILKQEFRDCGISLENVITIDNIKKWHSMYKHHISLYFFNPNFNLMVKVKGYEYHDKIPQILLMQNNIWNMIDDEKIKNSVVYGNVTDLIKFNNIKTISGYAVLDEKVIEKPSEIKFKITDEVSGN